jgi:hypothetical protein
MVRQQESLPNSKEGKSDILASNAHIMQSLQLIRESFSDVGNEMQGMHDSFNNEIDLVKKSIEK